MLALLGIAHGWAPSAAIRPATHVVTASCPRHALISLSGRDDLAAIQQRVATGLTNVVLSSRPGELLKTRDVDALFMLTFKATEKHMGVYTVQGRETEQAAKGTYLLAFEQHHDAAHFASLLQAQGLNSPAPTRKSAEQLREFCGKATLRLAVMPAGALPPTEEQLQEKRKALERLLQESPDGPTPDDGPL